MGKWREVVPLTDWTMVKEVVENKVITISNLRFIEFKSTAKKGEIVQGYVASLSAIDGVEVDPAEYRLLVSGQVLNKQVQQYLAGTNQELDQFPVDIVLYKKHEGAHGFYWMIGDPEDEEVIELLDLPI